MQLKVTSMNNGLINTVPVELTMFVASTICHNCLYSNCAIAKKEKIEEAKENEKNG